MKYIEQNWNRNTAIHTLPKSSNFIPDRGSYSIQGWLRVPDSNHLYDDFDVDVGHNLVNSPTWTFWTNNNNPNVEASAAVPDDQANDGNVLELSFPGGDSLVGPPNGSNVQTTEDYQYGTYKAILKAAQCQPDEGVITGFFTYWNEGVDENGNGIADNSEIDFEILGAAPCIVYMTIWTDFEEGIGFSKVTKAVSPPN